jgi:hypothetical protein
MGGFVLETGNSGQEPKPLEELRDVYDFLGQLRLRPGMWVPSGSLQDLQAMLVGYRVALAVHAVEEPFDFWPTGPFAEWLWEKRGASSPLGWAQEIERESLVANREPMEVFFALLDEYRAGLDQSSES